jgi:hypothetical protein
MYTDSAHQQAFDFDAAYEEDLHGNGALKAPFP